MSILRCYQVLGLHRGATPRQIHRAYRKLVHRHHPDHTHGDAESTRRFCEITEAHAALKRTLALQATGRDSGICVNCDRAAPLLRGINGGQYCADCLLARRRRFLPMPSYAQIRCLGVIATQSAAFYCTAMSIFRGSTPHGLAALAFLGAALAAMAIDFLRADIIDK
jgi:hypothetical protein